MAPRAMLYESDKGEELIRSLSWHRCVKFPLVGKNGKEINSKEVISYARNSEELYGDWPKFYYVFSRIPILSHRGLEDFVKYLSDNRDDVVLIAYSDGGVIAITGGFEVIPGGTDISVWFLRAGWPPIYSSSKILKVLRWLFRIKNSFNRS